MKKILKKMHLKTDKESIRFYLSSTISTVSLIISIIVLAYAYSHRWFWDSKTRATIDITNARIDITTGNQNLNHSEKLSFKYCLPSKVRPKSYKCCIPFWSLTGSQWKYWFIFFSSIFNVLSSPLKNLFANWIELHFGCLFMYFRSFLVDIMSPL